MWELSRAVGYDVDDRAARLAKHEAPDSPLLIAEGVDDLEALLHGLGVHGIDVSHSYRDARGGDVVVADDGHLDEGLVGDTTVTIQPMSIATSKPSNSTKKLRVSAVRSDLMFGTALLIITLPVLSDDRPALEDYSDLTAPRRERVAG